MKLNNITKGIFAILFVATLLVGCKKDEAPKEPLSVKEAKETLKDNINSLVECSKKLESGAFLNFFYDINFVVAKTEIKEYGWFNSYTNEYEVYHTEEIKKSWLTVIGEQFENQYTGGGKTNGFEYEKLKGIYNWNSSSKDWTKKADSHQIVLHFPSKKESTTNNATLILKDYLDEELSFKGEKERYPKAGNLTILVNEEKVFEAILENVSFKKGTNFSMPLTAKITLFTSPFTSVITLNKKTPEIFELNYNLSSSGGCATTNLYGEVTFKHSDYENFTSFGKDVKRLSLKLSHSNLVITANIDVEELNKLGKSSYTKEELNTYIKAEVYNEGRKVADLKADKGDNGVFPVFIFSDGSKEKVEKYSSDLAEKVEKVFERFKNNEVND